MVKLRWVILKSYLLVCMCLLSLPGYVSAQNKDSLLRQLQLPQQDTTKIKLLLAISEVCDQNDILLYAGQAKALSQKAIDAKREPASFYLGSLGEAINSIGFYYSHKDNPAKALENYKEALSIAEQVHNKKSYAYALNNIGYVYSNQGNVATALEYYYKNLKIQEELKDTFGIAYSLNNIAHSFLEQKDHKNAMDYYIRSLKAFESVHSKNGIAMVYANIGIIYSEENNRQKALESYNKSLALYEELGDEYYIAKELGSTAFEYEKLGQDSIALDRFYRVLAIGKKTHVKSIMSYAYASIADILFKKGNVDTSRQYALIALDYAKAAGTFKEMQLSARLLKDIYEKTGNYKDALAMQKLEVSIRDSVINASNYKTAISKKLQYDYDKKELQLKLDNEKKIAEKNMLIFSVVFIAVVVALLSYFYIRQSRLKTKVERMELEQQQYRSQMNPHFIFNCLNSIQYFIIHNDVKSANRYMSEFAALMRTTMENNKLQFIVLQQEIDYLTIYLTLEQMRFEDKFTFKIECDPGVDVSDTEILPSVIQPFAENAILHGLCSRENGGLLSISFGRDGDILICKIDDNGIGRQAAQAMKMQKGKTHISQGMELTKHRLALASSLYKRKYSVEIIDKIDNHGNASGTLVVLKFPIEA